MKKTNFKAHKMYFDDPMVTVEFPPNYYHTFIHPTNMKNLLIKNRSCKLKLYYFTLACTSHGQEWFWFPEH